MHHLQLTDTTDQGKIQPLMGSAAFATPWDTLDYLHIAPNVLPIAFVYIPLTMGIAITTEAGLSFLGYGDGELMSWGRTLHEVWIAQAVYQAWWWTVFPGLAILGLVLAGFMIGRAFEQVVNPKLRQR